MPKQLLHQPAKGVARDGSCCCAADATRLRASHGVPPDRPDVDKALDVTLAFWRQWAGRYRGETPWDGAVIRSLLTLKALGYRATGGMIAAPTTAIAGDACRLSQLGLSLLLAEGCDIHALGHVERRIRRRSHPMAQLDPAGDCQHSRSNAQVVRDIS